MSTTKTATQPMDPWLYQQLAARGHIAPGGVTRTARPRRCSCRQPILTGLDHPTHCALIVTADPVPLSPLGEVLALLDGRYTVTLNRESGRWVLNERYALQITGHPAGTRSAEDVLREHRCGTGPVTEAMATTSQHHHLTAVPLPPNAPAPF